MQTMTPAEGALMREHGGYWRQFLGKRWVVGFGPVADPKGAFGIGLWELPDGEDINALCAADPVIRAGTGFRYEIHPMPSLLSRG